MLELELELALADLIFERIMKEEKIKKPRDSTNKIE